MKDTSFNSLIAQLLGKNPESRLGGSFINLKKHAAFDRIEWVIIYLSLAWAYQ